MDGVVQQLEQFEHVLQVVEVEAEGVLFGRAVEVAAVHAVPQRNIGVYRSCAELRQPAHAGHGLGVFESEDQMLSHVGLYWLQVLDLVLVDENPDDSEVKIQVSHHLSP